MEPNSGGSNKKVCVAFSRRGNCAFGDKCESAHTRDSGGSTRRKRRAWKEKQGSGSRKASTPAPAPAPAPARSPAPALACVPNQPPLTFTPGVASRSPTPPDLVDTASRSVPTGRVSPPLSVMSRDICAFFASGECGVGDKCEFLHGSPASNPRPAPTLTCQAQEPPREVAPTGGSSWNSSGSSWNPSGSSWNPGGLSWDPTVSSSWDPIVPANPSQSNSSHTERGEVALSGSSWDPTPSPNPPPSKSSSSQSKPREVAPSVPSRDPTPSSKRPTKSNSRSSQSKPREGTLSTPSRDVATPSSNRPSKPDSSQSTPREAAATTRAPTPLSNEASNTSSSPSAPRDSAPSAPSQDPVPSSNQPSKSSSSQSMPLEDAPSVQVQNRDPTPSSRQPCKTSSSEPAPREDGPSVASQDPIPSSNQPSKSSSSPHAPQEDALCVPSCPTASSNQSSKSTSFNSSPREDAPSVESRNPTPSFNQPSKLSSAHSALREDAPTGSIPSRDAVSSSNGQSKSTLSSNSAPREDAPNVPSRDPAPASGQPSKPHSAPREDSPSVASRNPIPSSNRSFTPSSETCSPVRKDTMTQPVYRPASPFGYQGVPASSRVTKSHLREPEPEPEPESEPEPEPDAFDDDETDDGQFDDPDDQRISHPAPASSFSHSYEETSCGYSPTSAGSRPRIYPEVSGPPKPIPYVTDIIPHWSQFADPRADGNVPFCKLLAQNQCTQGEACRFRHALTIDEYVLLFKEQQPNLWTISRNPGGAQAMVPPPPLPLPPATSLGTPPQAMLAEVTSTRSMGRTKRVGPQKIPCGFYGLGQCKNGDKCSYAHMGTPPTTNDSSSQSRSSSSVLPASDESWNTTSRSNGLSKTFCRNLETYGTCKFGADCHYSHERAGDDGQTNSGSGWGNDDRQERNAGSSSKTICRNLETYGSCKFGDNCHYNHERADDGQAEQTNTNSGGGGSGWTIDDNNGSWGNTVNGDDGAAAAAATNGNDDWGPSSQRNDHNNTSSSTASGTGVRRPRPGTCYDFFQGRCRRADNCKFSHDRDGGGGGGYASGSGSDAFSRGNEPCRAYKRGNCSRSSCHYSHDLEGSCRGEDATAQDNGWGESALHTPESSWNKEGESRGEDQRDDADGAVEENNDSWGAAGNTWADDGVEVEVPEAVDNDDLWSEKPNMHPDSWEGTDGGGAQTKVQQPCKAFGQGVCTRGDDLHLLPEGRRQYHQEFAAENTNTEGEAPVEETAEEEVEDGHETAKEEDPTPSTTQVDVKEPEVEESETETEDVPDLERSMYHCTVRFNSRCAPERVMTAVDSRKVVLSNLPPGTNIDEIRDLVQGIGEMQDLAIMGEAEDFATMSIEFKEHADAMAAIKQLNNQLFSSHPIFAHLDLPPPVFARSPLLSQMLMVTWPGATVYAWVFYETVTLAKQAATKLDKTKFQDREIGAEYKGGKEKRRPYPILITGIPSSATKADLGALCKDPAPTLIDIGQPSYTDLPDDDIRRDLEKFGRIEQFQISSEGDPGFKTVAYVTMQSFSVADAASKALANTKPAYLGGEAPLRVKHIYHAAYKVLPKVFECIVDRLNVLREKFKEKCKIIDSSDGFLHTIETRAYIDELPIFSEANAALGNLVDGLLLVDDDGRPVWDPYLDTSSSPKAIDRLNNPNSDVPCFVHCDQRLRCVRVYGSLDGQERGKTGLMKILKMVKEQCREITLERPKISSLIKNGLATLRNSIGANKVSLDILGGRLIVRGTAEEYDKANIAVSALASSTPPETTGTRSTLCAFCERVPVSPVKLTCRHAYCKACLQFALSSTAQRDCAFFRCIFGGRSDGTGVCGAPLSYVVVRDHLTSTEEAEYMKAVFVAHVRGSNGLFFFCPTPDCIAVYRSGEEGIIIRCVMCAANLCPRCCSRAHDGSLCDESRISMITG